MAMPNKHLHFQILISGPIIEKKPSDALALGGKPVVFAVSDLQVFRKLAIRARLYIQHISHIAQSDTIPASHSNVFLFSLHLTDIAHGSKSIQRRKPPLLVALSPLSSFRPFPPSTLL